MKYAKAMYLGGEYISGEQCDYTSAKTYGLICPCCSSAVFLRGQGMRLNTLRNGKKKLQIINPYFAHYHTGIDDYDCELRSPYSFNEEAIERAAMEAREQRLKLYNKHLIDMHCQDHNTHELRQMRRRCKAIRAVFTETWQETIALRVRQEVADNPELYNNLLSSEALLEFATMPLREKLSLFPPELLTACLVEQLQQEDHIWTDYLAVHNLKLHTAIVHEIAEFTFTRTGGYFLKYLIDCHISRFYNLIGSHKVPEQVLLRVRQDTTPRVLARSAIHTINRTKWLDIIPKFMHERRES